MGSGWQAPGGWTHAAYLRNLRNQSDLNGTMVNNNGSASSDTGTGRRRESLRHSGFHEQRRLVGKLSLCGRTHALRSSQSDVQPNHLQHRHGRRRPARRQFGDRQRRSSRRYADLHLEGPERSGMGKQLEPFEDVHHRGSRPAALGVWRYHDHSDLAQFVSETDDNWNIQNVSITVNGSSGSACLYNHGGNPLARLTGSAPSVTLKPGTGC